MKKILLTLGLIISAFATPRYDYTIQNVFEYYNNNKNIVVNNGGWHFNNKGGYFNRKRVFFEVYVNSYGECSDTDHCDILVTFKLPYSNLSRASLSVTTNYKSIIGLKDGSISRTSQMICRGDLKGDFGNCEFIKEIKTN